MLFIEDSPPTLSLTGGNIKFALWVQGEWETMQEVRDEQTESGHISHQTLYRSHAEGEEHARA